MVALEKRRPLSQLGPYPGKLPRRRVPLVVWRNCHRRLNLRRARSSTRRLVIDLSRLQIVNVSALPWPATPGQSGNFCWLNDLSNRLSLAGTWPSDVERRLMNAELVAERMRTGDIKDCIYHQFDWGLLSEIAIEILSSAVANDAAIEAALRSRRADPARIRQVRSLLTRDDSILWSPEYPDDLGNGMKRICAMKQQGVPRTVVRTY
jgi:hypothetical protein